MHQRWALYDEEYALSGKGIYDKASPHSWLQSVHNYMAGRTEDMDRVLDWAEKQQGETPKDLSSCHGLPFIDCAEYKEVSCQLRAFLGPLVVGNAVVNVVFQNVDRHNGLEACRRIAEPINDDKSLILQELFAPVTKPRGAYSRRLEVQSQKQMPSALLLSSCSRQTSVRTSHCIGTCRCTKTSLS